MRILRYFSLRGLDGHHTRVYPRRFLGLVDYSEPHPYTTTDVSYRSVSWDNDRIRTYILPALRRSHVQLCFKIHISSGETLEG